MTASTAKQRSLWPTSTGRDATTRPTEHAYWHGSLVAREASRDEQRRLGQFMTPAPIARFMARRLLQDRHSLQGRTVRMLDPAAGSGVLAAALVERVLCDTEPPARIELLLCEIDSRLGSALRLTVAHLASLCRHRGVAFDAQLRIEDFLLSDLARSGAGVVDFVIANPPYFKIAGSDARADPFRHAVHGQPNIYALFVASCAGILAPGGGFCFITPRSWTNGAYFRALRRYLSERVSLDALHVFDSREDHFRDDAVLQEAVITWVTANLQQPFIGVSSSSGTADLDEHEAHLRPAPKILGAAPEHMITLAATENDDALSNFGRRLHDLELKASTGPVVGFRAKAHLRGCAGTGTVPMLWMPHVRRMAVEWPRGHRAEHIERNQRSAWMLLPNRPMVLMRRFSPKEDVRRVTAAAYQAQIPCDVIGLENHLNVVHRPNGAMSRDEAHGLAGYLNSALVDDHLRARLGSTQVNAVELRQLPLPDVRQLEQMGRCLRAGLTVDAALAQLLGRKYSEPTARHG